MVIILLMLTIVGSVVVGLAGDCWHCWLGWVLFQDFGCCEKEKHFDRSVGQHWERFGHQL